MSEGWIKLYRQLDRWEWIDTPNTFCLFIHLLLNANHKPNRHKGVLIGCGQIKTGRKSLASKTGLSEQSVRTALKNLVSSNDLTIKSTKHYSIITIVNWNKYQTLNQQSTNAQPTLNQRLTTNKNENNDKNVKNNRGSRLPKDWIATDEYINFALKEGLTIDAANREADKFKDYWQSATKNATKKDWLATWRNWIRRNKDFNKHKNTKGSVDDECRAYLESL